jgi:hypothetical protein
MRRMKEAYETQRWAVVAFSLAVFLLLCGYWSWRSEARVVEAVSLLPSVTASPSPSPAFVPRLVTRMGLKGAGSLWDIDEPMRVSKIYNGRKAVWSRYRSPFSDNLPGVWGAAVAREGAYGTELLQGIVKRYQARICSQDYLLLTNLSTTANPRAFQASDQSVLMVSGSPYFVAGLDTFCRNGSIHSRGYWRTGNGVYREWPGGQPGFMVSKFDANGNHVKTKVLTNGADGLSGGSDEDDIAGAYIEQYGDTFAVALPIQRSHRFIVNQPGSPDFVLDLKDGVFKGPGLYPYNGPSLIALFKFDKDLNLIGTPYLVDHAAAASTRSNSFRYGIPTSDGGFLVALIPDSDPVYGQIPYVSVAKYGANMQKVWEKRLTVPGGNYYYFSAAVSPRLSELKDGQGVVVGYLVIFQADDYKRRFVALNASDGSILYQKQHGSGCGDTGTVLANFDGKLIVHYECDGSSAPREWVYDAATGSYLGAYYGSQIAGSNIFPTYGEDITRNSFAQDLFIFQSQLLPDRRAVFDSMTPPLRIFGRYTQTYPYYTPVQDVGFRSNEPSLLQDTTDVVATADNQFSAQPASGATQLVDVTSPYQYQTNFCDQGPNQPPVCVPVTMVFEPYQLTISDATDVSLVLPKTIAPAVTGESDQIDFGPVIVGQSVTRTLYLRRTLDSSITLSPVWAGGDTQEFNYVETCSSVGQGEPCTVTVTFTPSYQYNFSATLRLETGIYATQILTFSGRGVAARTLNVTRSGSGSGSVTSAPSGIDCGSTCSAQFGEGVTVQLQATPSSGSYFAGWTGDCSGQGNPCTLTMDGNKTVGAIFNSGPQIVLDQATLGYESCAVNGALDPNERVTVNVRLKNVGGSATQNLVAIPTNLSGSDSAAQSYGAIAVGGTATRGFSFTVQGNCGDLFTLNLLLRDGGVDLGQINVPLRIGQASGSGYVCATCGGTARVVVSLVGPLACDVDGKIVATLRVRNSGTAVARQVVLTRASLNSGISGSPLPQAIGDLLPGDERLVTVRFNAGASGNALLIEGSYSGGGFSGVIRVTVPNCGGAATE